MNKHLHRIIFNHARGVLMAVAECASSHSRGDAKPDASQPREAALVRPSFNVHPIVSAIFVLIGCTVGFAPYAEAQIVSDPNAPKNQQATILNAGNGVPLVNIQTPSGAGVSRNIYSQFDVQANGAILNNSRSNAQTQLGGWVQGNPWLATGSARVILNEVNSANPSQLRGYVEVAGSRAQVVIANPAGVTCDGCGFINANRATLTTGTPIMNGGNLDGFRVERGQILIQGSGLDARQVDYTDLIARAITVNAGIWANNLRLVTGANQVDAEAGAVTPIAGSGPAPSFALDVGQLGGMYAGKIVMVGSEAGVGVKNAGQIGAAIGEISLTAEGRLINAGTISTTAQTLSLNTRGLDNSGTLSSQADIAITSQGEITNSGLINAGRELKLEIAGSIDNRGTLSGQRLDFSADRLANTGTIRQTGSQGLMLSAGNILNQLGATLGHLTSSTIPNQSTSSSSTNSSTSTTADAPSTAAGGGSVTSLPVTPEVLADGRIALRGDLTNSGQLTGNGRFDTSATRLDNRGTVNLDALSITGDHLLNAGGTLIVTDFTARTTAFDNTAGQIKVARNLSINTTDLINVHGSILHAGTSDLGIQVGAALNNTDGVLNSNASQLNLSAGTLDNTRGQILTQGVLTIQTTQGPLTNDAGLIQSGGAMSINTQGQTLSNRNAGQLGIISQGTLTVNSGNLDNTSGYLGALGGIDLTTGALTNTSGVILGSNSTRLNLTSLDNAGGQIQSAGTLTVNATGTLGNTGGLLRSGSTLSAQANRIDNNQTTSNNQGIEGYDITLSTPSLNNNSGAIRADRDLSFTGSGTLDNTSGLLSAGNLLSIQDAQTFSTLAITNTGGRQIAGQKLDIKAASLTGDGQLLALGDLKLALTGSFTNSNKVQAGNNLNLSTQGALSNSGTLQAGNNLDLSAAAIDNQASGEISASGITHLTTGTLTNRGLIDGSDTRIDATTVNNLGSGRIYGDHLSIAAVNLNNLNENGLSPTLAARTRLDLAVTGTLTNDLNALIFSAGNLAIGGALDANRQAIGRGGVINNNGGTIQSLGEMSITTQRINNTNPNFSATVTAGPTVYKTTYNTSQGTITADQIAWQIDNQGWDGTPILAGNASPNFQAPTTLLLVKKDSPYANDAGYFWLHVYAGATTTVSCDIDSNCTTVPVPPTISTTYAADNPIWSRFGITPPATALPSASQPVAPVAPTQTCDEFGNCTPPAPALVSAWAAAYAAWQIADAAWQAAAAPYIALQHQLDNLRGSINGSSRLTVYSIINESYQPLVAQVLSSTPGQILSGSTMTLDASQALINDKSRIIAGGALNVFGQSIANIAAEVSGIESHTGTSSAWAYGGHDGKSTGHHCDCDFYFFKPAYYALDVLVTLTSPIALVQQYQAPGGGSAVPGQGSAASIGATSTPGAFTGTQATGTSPLALSVPVNLTVPATSLYHLHPGLSSGYLIETDPRFANYRNWLSSDYLLKALAYAPTSVQKRLGDGFYEQQLIREQIALLTGQRFLQGYQSDEAQYLALMNQGATVAQAWQLRPGVALSASQVAQLTSDIVWLVEQTVTLPDGTTQQVLVPQVYVVPRQGDLKGDGTLLAGNTVRLAASGDFTNSGTVAGRSLVDLSAHNIKNLGGQIAGDKVSLSATNDIDNIGGRITANSSLALMAGRDINVKSTTVSGSGQSTLGQTTGQFTATRLDRLAGLYVTGDKGLLTVVAGRDINLTAAEVKNTQGDSQLLAGRDLNLETLTLSQKSDIRYSSGNTAKFGNSTEIGTTIKSGGSLALAAGNDINARATRIDAQGDLSLKAGNDINVSAGRNEQYIDQATQQSKKTSGLFGKTTNKTTAFQEERSDAVGSSLSGQNISLQSGRDLSLEAATLTAQNQLALNAGRDLTVSTAESYVVRNEQQKVSTKENYFPGKQSLKTTRDEITVTPTVSQLSARDITLQSGRDLTLVAPRITADTLTAFAGNQLTIAAATATHELNESSEFKTNRFNFSEVTNPSVTGARIKDKIKLTESEGQRQAVVAEIDAKTITLNSIGDTVLVAPKIKAETLSIEAGSVNGEIINPEARIQFLGVKESTTASSSKNSHSFVHETVRDGGSSSETLKLSDIQLSGKGDSPSLALAAPGGIVVGATSLTPTQKELQATDSASGTSGNTAKPPPGQFYDLKSQAQTLAQQPGLAWLGELSQRKDVDWQQIELAQQNWDYKRSGLTQEGAAVVAIVVAAVTWGAASGVGTAAVQGVGMSTAAGTAGAVAASAIAAGLSTLASQAAVSLINNQGDIGKTLEDLGSKENIQQLVTSMLTAGALQAVGGTSWANSISQSTGLPEKLVTNLTNAVVKSTISTAIQGGDYADNLKTSLITAGVDTAAGWAANNIGDWYVNEDLAGKYIAHKVAHALLGCAGAAAKGGDCASGAIGAAVGEAFAEMIGQNAGTDTQKFQVLQFSRLVAMASAKAAGKDWIAAGDAATLAVANNFLMHSEAKKLAELKQQRQACTVPADCASLDREIREIKLTNAQRDEQIKQACANPASESCATWNTFAQIAKSSYQGQSTYDPNGIIVEEQREAAKIAYQYNQRVLHPTGYDLGGKALVGLAGAAVVVVGVEAAAACFVSLPTCIPFLNTLADGMLADGAVGAAGYTGSKVAAQQLKEAVTVARAELPMARMIDDLIGKTITSPSLSKTAQLHANDGKLAEQVGRQVLKEETGRDFRMLVNSSDNGADGVTITRDPLTIYVAEVKSSINGVDKANVAEGNPARKLRDWAELAADGKGKWASLSAEDRAFALELDALIKGGTPIKGIQVQVGIPRTGQSGIPDVRFSEWK